jgi:hypothetical protein
LTLTLVLTLTPTLTLTQVYNDADSAIALFWENPTSRELSTMGPAIQPQHSFGLDSYANHRFVVQFADHVTGSEVRFVKGK